TQTQTQTHRRRPTSCRQQGHQQETQRKGRMRRMTSLSMLSLIFMSKLRSEPQQFLIFWPRLFFISYWLLVSNPMNAGEMRGGGQRLEVVQQDGAHFNIMSSWVLQPWRHPDRNRSWSHGRRRGDSPRRAAVLGPRRWTWLIHDRRVVRVVAHVEARWRSLARVSIATWRAWIWGHRVTTVLRHGLPPLLLPIGFILSTPSTLHAPRSCDRDHI
ncbi:hypothetical protein INR49_011853, partial [Caranx melampygus]